MRQARRLIRLAAAKRRDDEPQRRRWNYRVRDTFGRAPPLPSDTRGETVLKSVPAWKRGRASYFISQNGSKAYWYGPSDPKRRPKRGFDVGSLEDLKLQARRGGVLLPARATPAPGSRKIAVDADLRDILERGDKIRIGDHAVFVKAVAEDHVMLRICWLFESNEDLPIFHMPPLGLGGRVALKARREAYENYLTQSTIVATRHIVLWLAAKEKYYAKRWRPSRYATKLKRRSRRHEQLAERIRWRTVYYQLVSERKPVVVDDDEDDAVVSAGGRRKKPNPLADRNAPAPESFADIEALKNQARENAYMGVGDGPPAIEETAWVECVDEASGKRAWRHRFTDEVTTEKPDELKTQRELDFEAAKRARTQKSVGRRGLL